ncbi:hypothetical protein IMZ11_41845 [Microtetraspora sp. AC03309]|nr:hypothetical protein [Microtetraspora sp. AC03309]
MGTALVVAVLALAFFLMQWDTANKVATAVSALAGLAAVGIAVWAGWPLGPGGKSVHVSKTGCAVTQGSGSANAGFAGKANEVPDRLRVDRTGDAKASGGGDANSGIRLD